MLVDYHLTGAGPDRTDNPPEALNLALSLTGGKLEGGAWR